MCSKCNQKPPSNCINASQVTTLKKRTRANLRYFNFWSLKTYQQKSLSSPTRLYAAPHHWKAFTSDKTGLRKNERSIVSDTGNTKYGHGKKNSLCLHS